MRSCVKIRFHKTWIIQIACRICILRVANTIRLGFFLGMCQMLLQRIQIFNNPILENYFLLNSNLLIIDKMNISTCSVSSFGIISNKYRKAFFEKINMINFE